MIPIKLTIEGLYSYQELQIIDFSKLTAVGLFGIFGATGSGKSSILEAISFSLYGETERMNTNNRAYNMMNLKSNKMYIEFDFENFEGKKFRAVRSYKRNSKNYDDVKSKAKPVIFYSLENEEPEPLEDKDATLILGNMSYENFRRTVIIPQGKFREFMELKPKDRSEMLKEIFNLHQFDLFNKTREVSTLSEAKLNQLDGRLMGFETVTKEAVAELRDLWSEQKQKQTATLASFQVLDLHYQQLQSVRKDFELLKEKKQELARYQTKMAGIEEEEARIKSYERMLLNFKSPIENFDRLQQERIRLGKQKAENEAALEKTTNEIAQLNEEQNEISPRFKILPQKRQEEAELQTIRKIFVLEQEAKGFETRVEKGKQYVEKVKNQLKLKQEEEATLTISIQQGEQQLLDWQLLGQVKSWFQSKKGLEDQQNQLKTKLKTGLAKLNNLQADIEQQGITFENYTSFFEEKEKGMKLQAAALNKQRNELEVQQKLANYSDALVDGAPCPLCGSEHHPHVANINDVSETLFELNKEIQQNEEAYNALQKKRKDVGKQVTQYQVGTENVALVKSDLEQKEVEIKEHQKAFIWPDFDPMDEKLFLEKEAANKETDTILKQKRAQLASIRKEENDFRNDLNKAETGLNGLLNKLAECRNSGQTLTQTLKFLNIDDYKERSKEDLDQFALQLKKENDSCEKRYNDLTTEITTKDKNLTALTTQQENIKTLVEENQRKTAEIQEKIDALLTTEKVDSLDKIRKTLSQEIDLPESKKRIQQFWVAFTSLKNGVSDLEKKLNLVQFNEDGFKQTEAEWKMQKGLLDELNKTLATQETRLKDLEARLVEKKEIEKERETVLKRVQNLALLKKLFQGAGFVEYVANTYLSRLCDEANLWFSRMTHGQLNLILNLERNNLEIIDYLNDGKTRSVQTLSGGQAFQASLSLALALADSVQSTAKADKSFFFIDEGFGTQDEDSLNVVFDTLLELNKANKIVGIISHVDELKERVPLSLSVVQDLNKGSLVNLN